MVNGADLQGESKAVDWCRGRNQQQMRDVECALFVFEDGALAGEGEFPEAEAAPEGEG